MARRLGRRPAGPRGPGHGVAAASRGMAAAASRGKAAATNDDPRHGEAAGCGAGPAASLSSRQKHVAGGVAGPSALEGEGGGTSFRKRGGHGISCETGDVGLDDNLEAVILVKSYNVGVGGMRGGYMIKVTNHIYQQNGVAFCREDIELGSFSDWKSKHKSAARFPVAFCREDIELGSFSDWKSKHKSAARFPGFTTLEDGERRSSKNKAACGTRVHARKPNGGASSCFVNIKTWVTHDSCATNTCPDRVAPLEALRRESDVPNAVHPWSDTDDNVAMAQVQLRDSARDGDDGEEPSRCLAHELTEDPMYGEWSANSYLVEGFLDTDKVVIFEEQAVNASPRSNTLCHDRGDVAAAVEHDSGSHATDVLLNKGGRASAREDCSLKSTAVPLDKDAMDTFDNMNASYMGLCFENDLFGEGALYSTAVNTIYDDDSLEFTSITGIENCLDLFECAHKDTMMTVSEKQPVIPLSVNAESTCVNSEHQCPGQCDSSAQAGCEAPVVESVEDRCSIGGVDESRREHRPWGKAMELHPGETSITVPAQCSFEGNVEPLRRMEEDATLNAISLNVDGNQTTLIEPESLINVQKNGTGIEQQCAVEHSVVQTCDIVNKLLWDSSVTSNLKEAMNRTSVSDKEILAPEAEVLIGSGTPVDKTGAEHDDDEASSALYPNASESPYVARNTEKQSRAAANFAMPLSCRQNPSGVCMADCALEDRLGSGKSDISLTDNISARPLTTIVEPEKKVTEACDELGVTDRNTKRSVYVDCRNTLVICHCMVNGYHNCGEVNGQWSADENRASIESILGCVAKFACENTEKSEEAIRPVLQLIRVKITDRHNAKHSELRTTPGGVKRKSSALSETDPVGALAEERDPKSGARADITWQSSPNATTKQNINWDSNKKTRFAGNQRCQDIVEEDNTSTWPKEREQDSRTKLCAAFKYRGITWSQQQHDRTIHMIQQSFQEAIYYTVRYREKSAKLLEKYKHQGITRGQQQHDTTLHPIQWSFEEAIHYTFSYDKNAYKIPRSTHHQVDSSQTSTNKRSLELARSQRRFAGERHLTDAGGAPTSRRDGEGGASPSVSQTSGISGECWSSSKCSSLPWATTAREINPDRSNGSLQEKRQVEFMVDLQDVLILDMGEFDKELFGSGDNVKHPHNMGKLGTGARQQRGLDRTEWSNETKRPVVTCQQSNSSLSKHQPPARNDGNRGRFGNDS